MEPPAQRRGEAPPPKPPQAHRKPPRRHAKPPQARCKGAFLALTVSSPPSSQRTCTRPQPPSSALHKRADGGRGLRECAREPRGAPVRDIPRGADCRPSAPPLVSLSALTAVRHAAEGCPSAAPTGFVSQLEGFGRVAPAGLCDYGHGRTQGLVALAGLRTLGSGEGRPAGACPAARQLAKELDYRGIIPYPALHGIKRPRYREGPRCGKGPCSGKKPRWGKEPCWGSPL